MSQRRVMITGAGRGFGRELFRVFAEHGWTIFPLVRNDEVAAELAATDGVEVHPIVGDVASEEVSGAISEQLSIRADSLDLLINNAGIIRKRHGLTDAPVRDFEALFKVHCVGSLRCVNAALPYLRKSERSVIVNVSSRKGSIARVAEGGGSNVYSYQVSKAALNMLTACLDDELRGDGVRAFSVHPGQLKTAVAPPDADTDPRDAALAFYEWFETVGAETPCVLHDPVGGGVIPW